MKKKLFFSLGALAMILLLSGVISIVEYGRMRIELSHKLEAMTEEYNSHIGTVATLLTPQVDSLTVAADSLGTASDSLGTAADSTVATFDIPFVDVLPELNMDDFDEGLYRCIIPVVVSGCAGLLLIILLLYFIMVYYVKPIYRISDGIDAYRLSGRRYVYEFDGDDQLANVNSGLTELIDENMELKKRVKNLRDDREKMLQNISDLTAE